MAYRWLNQVEIWTRALKKIENSSNSRKSYFWTNETIFVWFWGQWVQMWALKITRNQYGLHTIALCIHSCNDISRIFEFSSIIFLIKCHYFLRVFGVAQFKYRLQNFPMESIQPVRISVRWYSRLLRVGNLKNLVTFLIKWDCFKGIWDCCVQIFGFKTHKKPFFISSVNRMHLFVERKSSFFIITYLWGCF